MGLGGGSLFPVRARQGCAFSASLLVWRGLGVEEKPGFVSAQIQAKMTGRVRRSANTINYASC